MIFSGRFSLNLVVRDAFLRAYSSHSALNLVTSVRLVTALSNFLRTNKMGCTFYLSVRIINTQLK